MSTHTWPIRSYPTECVVENDRRAGPWTARHYTHFKSFDGSKSFNGDNTWFSWSEDAPFDGFDMEPGDEILVQMELDWKDGASRDASLVFWGTGSDALDIEPITP